MTSRHIVKLHRSRACFAGGHMRSRADNSGIQKAALQFTARDHFCEHHTQRRLPPNMDFSYKLLHKRTHWSLVTGPPDREGLATRCYQNCKSPPLDSSSLATPRPISSQYSTQNSKNAGAAFPAALLSPRMKITPGNTSSSHSQRLPGYHKETALGRYFTRI